ncbi:MAG: hypothetical protein M2R45_04534 [Verrucomicrobia subdivision 3 bacterium]|nr:hypothetical protein [Limisphaerales bacterium]MCS1416827.1 hypothetical protein [Limisphaerales bacterium]
MLSESIAPVHRKVLKAGKRIKDSVAPDNYHRLRIRCKRLVRLQSLLGDYNDTSVAIDYLRELLEKSGRRLPDHMRCLR